MEAGEPQAALSANLNQNAAFTKTPKVTQSCLSRVSPPKATSRSEAVPGAREVAWEVARPRSARLQQLPLACTLDKRVKKSTGCKTLTNTVVSYGF